MAASSDDEDGSREQSGSQNTAPNRRTRSLPPTVPTPVTTTRLRDWFRDREYTYFVDNDGDLGGLWKGRTFFFLLFGPHQEILQIRGHWNRDFAIERLPELLDLCNTWHIEQIWPTTYTRVRDDGMVNVTCEVTGDVTEGATNAQLSLLLQCGLETASVFFDELDSTYPDPAALAP